MGRMSELDIERQMAMLDDDPTTPPLRPDPEQTLDTCRHLAWLIQSATNELRLAIAADPTPLSNIQAHAHNIVQEVENYEDKCRQGAELNQDIEWDTDDIPIPRGGGQKLHSSPHSGIGRGKEWRESSRSSFFRRFFRRDKGGAGECGNSASKLRDRWVVIAATSGDWPEPVLWHTFSLPLEELLPEEIRERVEEAYKGLEEPPNFTGWEYAVGTQYHFEEDNLPRPLPFGWRREPSNRKRS